MTVTALRSVNTGERRTARAGGRRGPARQSDLFGDERPSALVDTPALIDALKDGQLGYLGLDVYEEEAALFFEDQSDLPLQDDVLARLLTFPNVIITAHQAFLTREALSAIAETTLSNIADWAAGTPNNLVTA